MSLLDLLGFSRGRSDCSAANPLVAAIKRELGNLPPQHVERVAAYAGLLVRVAHSDAAISEQERVKLAEIVAAHTALDQRQAQAVAALVVRQATELEGIEYALLTRAVNDFADRKEKELLIDCLYAVATADEEVSVIEDDEIRAVAKALLLSHEQFIRIRQPYKEKLEVMRSLRNVATKPRA